MPIKEYQLIGEYYLIWCEGRNKKFETAELEKLVDRTHTYKAKALASIGTFEWYKGDNKAALYFYKEALKASPTVSEYLDLSKALAVLKSQDGFNKAAVTDLENLLPLIKHAEPLVYYEFLNSYAVELTEAGRVEEAKNISALVCRSPFAPYYKEWQETYADAHRRLRNRQASVSVSLPYSAPRKRVKKAKILNFPLNPKESFLRASQGPPTEAETQAAIARGVNLDPKQLLALIIKIVAQDRLPDSDIYKIVSVYYDALVTADK